MVLGRLPDQLSRLLSLRLQLSIDTSIGESLHHGISSSLDISQCKVLTTFAAAGNWMAPDLRSIVTFDESFMDIYQAAYGAPAQNNEVGAVNLFTLFIVVIHARHVLYDKQLYIQLSNLSQMARISSSHSTLFSSQHSLHSPCFSQSICWILLNVSTG
jgi:hypothetical protein